MEEDKIKDIFQRYDPDLSSSMAFMERLERNMDAIEFIHKENAAVMKRNRIAVYVATCLGFISGIIFTLLLPYLKDMIGSVMEAIPVAFFQSVISGYTTAISWIIIGAASVFIAVNTYDITLSLQPLRGGRREG